MQGAPTDAFAVGAFLFSGAWLIDERHSHEDGRVELVGLGVRAVDRAQGSSLATTDAVEGVIDTGQAAAGRDDGCVSMECRLTSPIHEIERLAPSFFDALYNGDTALFAEIFHPAARLYSFGGGSETLLDVPAYLAIVAGRQNPCDRGDPRQDEILAIEVPTPTTALLRTRELFPPKRFTDDLALLRGPGGWRIVAKIWDFELLPAAAS